MAAKNAPRDVIDVEPLESPAKDRSLTRVETDENSAKNAPEPVLPPKPSGGGWIVFLGFCLALLWIGGGAAYLIGFSGITTMADLSPVQMAGLGFVLTAPALFIILAALAARQMTRFGAQARAVELASAQLLTPSDTATGQARTLAEAVSGEIERINKAMESALARLGAIEEVLRHHGDSIKDAASHAEDRSKVLITDLRAERDALNELADTLDNKAKSVADAISEQSNMVARAAELAESAAAEGETTLSEAAKALLDAAETTLKKTNEAGNSLETGRSRLIDLSESLNNQRVSLDKTYSDHRTHLESATDSLRKEQDKIAAALDFHRAELDSLTRIARKGAEELRDATESGGGAMRGAVETAIEQAQRFTDIIRTRTREAAEHSHEELEKLDSAANRARETSEEARKMLAKQAEDLRAQIEKLHESTFEAATRTDSALQRQLDDAAKAVERVSAMSDNADHELAKRFDVSMETWRKRVEELEGRFAAMQTSLDAFPDAARQRVTELESTVQKGIEALNKAAHASAEDAKDIDFALQARMRQNYELLSEFVLRMGSVSSGSRPSDHTRDDNLPDPLSRVVTGGAGASGPADQAGPGAERSWRWRDLVSDLREREAPHSAPQHARQQPEEPDINADLISDRVVEKAAAARRTSGIGAMREAVSDEMSGAINDLRARLQADASLKNEAQALVDELEPEISRAARQEQVAALMDILISSRGRAYLLASASLGEA